DFTFRGRIAQKIGGMIGGQQFSSAKFQPLAAKLRDAAIGLQQRFGGSGAEAHNYLWSDDVNLTQEKWRASLDFVFFRLTVLRWPALHDVADIDVIALQAHGFDHLC